MTTADALQTYQDDMGYNTDRADRLPWVNAINDALEKGTELHPLVHADWVYEVFKLAKAEKSNPVKADSN